MPRRGRAAARTILPDLPPRNASAQQVAQFGKFRQYALKLGARGLWKRETTFGYQIFAGIRRRTEDYRDPAARLQGDAIGHR